MKKEPIRILHVVNIMDRAGIETMLMNYYRNIDRSKVQFDFLTHRDDKGAYDDEIVRMGGRVYHAPRLYPQNYINYGKYMTAFFEEHKEYDIVHSHIDNMSAFPLFFAKKHNIKVRIAHSHNTKFDYDYKYLIKKICHYFVPVLSNNYFACGDAAGKYMFKNKDFTILNNAIDIENFEFNSKKRKEIRKKLNLEDSFVIGHVGRYTNAKNQMFLIDVFNAVKSKKNNAKLMLIGKGEDENKLREKAKNLGLTEDIIFLIDRSDVNELYQAMDIFVMPSLFEGLPVVAVEAETNGLPCLFASKISAEVLITSNTHMLKLEDGIDKWCEKILNIECERNKDAKIQITKAGFNVKEECKKLETMYENFLHNEVKK